MQNANNRGITKANKPLVPLVERNDYVLGSDSILGRTPSKTFKQEPKQDSMVDSNQDFSRYLTNSILQVRPDEYRPRPLQSLGMIQQVTRGMSRTEDRQVDMDTYVREQRRLIHQMSGRQDSNEPSDVRYEIQEFKRPQRLIKREARVFAEGVKDPGESKDILKIQSLQKSKRHLQSLLSGLDKSRGAYNTVGDTGSMHVSRFEVDSGRSPNPSPRPFKTVEAADTGLNRSAQVSRRAHPTSESLLEKKPIDKGYVFEENSAHSRHVAAPPRGLVDRRVDRFARKSHNKSMDAMKMLASESQRGPAELIIVGDDNASSTTLSQLFKKKMKIKDKGGDNRSHIRDNHTFRQDIMTPEPSATITEPKDYCRNKSSDLSKMDLRKKMLEYGKKIEKPKVKKTEETVHQYQSGLHSVSSAQTLKRGDMNDRKASPKPDVLERLARGIKPKVDKSEIHQITRRQMEKFQKLKQQGSLASPTKTDQKKAEMLERKSKVKQLDQVGSSADCSVSGANSWGVQPRKLINILQGTLLILITF